ncbi:exported hypothetical protein [Candidatus Sulfopaludibacter sp. SbA3]|nr:exported hypothetical protein [Candidatus Sulfopaludibacter sp. SbA3]
MNKYCALLALLCLPVSAADRVFTGSLERVRRASISIRMADGLVVDATLPAGTAVPYNVADQVEITCTPAKTVYDAQAGLHYHLQLKNLRLIRPASPRERAETIALLSWQTGENLLKLPSPAPPSGEPSELDRVRQVNLEYASKLPNFVADETGRRYHSDGVGKPWRLQDTMEDEIGIKDDGTTRQNVRVNGKPRNKPSAKLPSDFGLHLYALFDLSCPTKIEFAGRGETGGKPILVYLFHSPPKGCFGGVNDNGHVYEPAVSGRILVDAAKGNVLRCEWEGSGFPEKFVTDRLTIAESWDYATVGGSVYLVPVSFEWIGRRSDGEMVRATTEYKNHRHFEASTRITFGTDK